MYTQFGNLERLREPSGSHELQIAFIKQHHGRSIRRHDDIQLLEDHLQHLIQSERAGKGQSDLVERLRQVAAAALDLVKRGVANSDRRLVCK